MNSKERKEMSQILDHIEEELRGLRGMIRQDIDRDKDINKKCVMELKKYLRHVRFDASNLIPVVRKYHETSSKASAMSISYKYIKYMVEQGLIEPVGTYAGKTQYELIQ